MFPPAQSDEVTALGDDIRDRGKLLLPIWLFEGQIIDGWQRYLACREHRVEPVFQTWNGPADQLLGVVIALKLRRQHLTSSQRAAVAVKVLLPELERAAAARQRTGKKAALPQHPGEASRHSGEATEQAAKAVGTNRDYVDKAKRLSRYDTRSNRSGWRGEVSVVRADAELHDGLDRLQRECPELVAAVEQARLTLPNALKRLPVLLRKQRESSPRSAEAVEPDASDRLLANNTGCPAENNPASNSGNQQPPEAEGDPVGRWLTLRRAKAALRRWAGTGRSGEYDTATRTFQLHRRGRPAVAVPPRIFWIDDTEFVVWPAASFNTD